VHIKGFQFTAPARAYEKVSFAAHDHIYGDSYTVTADAVEKIGNNVSITFEGLDFSVNEKTAGEIEIAWRASRDNSIRIVFIPEAQQSPDDNTVELLNQLSLPPQADYAPTRLTLGTPLQGKGTLRFIFLPGTEIDFAWFRFV
jgi:beta-galactosidase